MIKEIEELEIKDVITNVEVAFLDKAIKASKYPMSTDTSKCTSEITKRTISLATCPKGEGHDCFLNGIKVAFDLTLTIKAWTEAERYHWLDFISSQSTMHKAKDMKIADCCISYVDARVIEVAQEYVDKYNADPTPENYLNMIYNIPIGLKLTAGMTTNYQQLKTIYAQRENHRLPEWRAFCRWIETLPNSEFITGGLHD